MAAAKSGVFPYGQAPYSYAGPALQKAWKRLHAGDREPFPRDAAVVEAWRAFHRGDFAAAITQGSGQGPPGISAPNKAAAVQASYLIDNHARAR